MTINNFQLYQKFTIPGKTLTPVEGHTPSKATVAGDRAEGQLGKCGAVIIRNLTEGAAWRGFPNYLRNRVFAKNPVS